MNSNTQNAYERDDRCDVMSTHYEDLGVLSSAPPERSIPLSCADCRVRWTGCADAAECPRCGSTIAYDTFAAIVDGDRVAAGLSAFNHATLHKPYVMPRVTR